MSLDHNGLNFKMRKIVCCQLFFLYFYKKKFKAIFASSNMDDKWMTKNRKKS